jgi:hypothetical protein
MSYQPESGYEYAYAENQARRGPLRFEEGVATDTDVPFEFGRGAYGDTDVDNPPAWVWKKDPMETQRQKAHIGSASWIEAPTELQEFVQGASMDHPSFERVQGSETRIFRPNPTVVGDM